MFIGAQVAGKVEAQHTPAASKAFAAQVQAKGVEISQLTEKLATVGATERPVLETQLKTLEAEKAELRVSELKAIEWKPLWGKPAIFAGVIMLLFIVFFRAPPRQVKLQ